MTNKIVIAISTIFFLCSMQKETDWKSIIVVTNEKVLTYDLAQTERLKVKFRRAKNNLSNVILKYII